MNEKENWWFPKKGNGDWKVKLEPTRLDHSDFGLCVNVRTGERKGWQQLKGELYGEEWEELIREILITGKMCV